MGLHGTVIVAAWENFIERHPTKAFDYGLIAYYNCTTSRVTSALTKGVKVEMRILEIAQAEGFEDKEKLKGKKTCGSVFAERFHVLADDWHEAVCGQTRMQLGQDALENKGAWESLPGKQFSLETIL